MNESSIYPGTYRPSPEMEKMIDNAATSHTLFRSRLLLHMSETPGCYTIELAMPEIKRENIFMHVHHHRLSIVFLTKDKHKKPGSNAGISELDGRIKERHIVLPRDADAEFISAEYKSGRLCLHIPKTSREAEIKGMPIVVY